MQKTAQKMQKQFETMVDGIRLKDFEAQKDAYSLGLRENLIFLQKIAGMQTLEQLCKPFQSLMQYVVDMINKCQAKFAEVGTVQVETI